jgi:hypothetical protein
LVVPHFSLSLSIILPKLKICLQAVVQHAVGKMGKWEKWAKKDTDPYIGNNTRWTFLGCTKNSHLWDIGEYQLHKTYGRVIDHGLMLSLSIAKQRDLLNSQLPVYVGDRQAPPDLLNLLPEGTDSDPDVWLTRHNSIPAFPRRNASRRSFGPKTYF